MIKLIDWAVYLIACWVILYQTPRGWQHIVPVVLAIAAINMVGYLRGKNE